MQSLLRPRSCQFLRSAARSVDVSPRTTGHRLRAAQSFSTQTETTAAAAAAAAAADAAPYEWQYPKAKALFEKITAQLHTEAEVRALQQHVYADLGRPLRENEFYYDGFSLSGKSGGGGGGGGATASEEEAAVEAKPTAFDVKLVGFDAKAKIKVIKEIRSVAGLGLKEAKELVDSAPSVIQKGLSAEAAEELKAKLVELGAEIELV